MLKWGDIYAERDSLGAAIIRCIECGGALFHEHPEMPCEGPITCDECRELRRQKPRSQVSVRQKMKVISGGQTGSDIGGLVAARKLGFKTGGTAPLDFMTEKGPQPILTEYGLVECDSKDYLVRTRLNIEHADLTLILARLPLTGGSKRTEEIAKELRKEVFAFDPWQHLSAVRICNLLLEKQPKILNIAGNRESKSPGIAKQVSAILQEALVLFLKFSGEELERVT